MHVYRHTYTRAALKAMHIKFTHKISGRYWCYGSRCWAFPTILRAKPCLATSSILSASDCDSLGLNSVVEVDSICLTIINYSCLKCDFEWFTKPVLTSLVVFQRKPSDHLSKHLFLSVLSYLCTAELLLVGGLHLLAKGHQSCRAVIRYVSGGWYASLFPCLSPRSKWKRGLLKVGWRTCQRKCFGIALWFFKEQKKCPVFVFKNKQQKK